MLRGAIEGAVRWMAGGGMLAWLAALCLGGAAWAQPAALAGLRLVDHRQQALTAAQLAGRPVLLHFVFTGCSATCPLQVQQLRAVQAALAPAVRRQVQFVSVTVDPVADTPQALAAFARRQQADQPGWRFVTGAPDQVLAVADRMQVFARPQPPAAGATTAAQPLPAKATPTPTPTPAPAPAPNTAARPAPAPAPEDHRSAVYLFAADGRLLQRFRGTPVDQVRLADELTRLVAQPL